MIKFLIFSFLHFFLKLINNSWIHKPIGIRQFGQVRVVWNPDGTLDRGLSTIAWWNIKLNQTVEFAFSFPEPASPWTSGREMKRQTLVMQGYPNLNINDTNTVWIDKLLFGITLKFTFASHFKNVPEYLVETTVLIRNRVLDEFCEPILKDRLSRSSNFSSRLCTR